MVKKPMTELNVFPTCMKVNQNVLAFYHRIEVQAGNVLVDFIFIFRAFSHLLDCRLLNLGIKTFDVHQSVINCQMSFSGFCAVVAVKKGTQK